MTVPFLEPQRLTITTLKVTYPGATFPARAADAFYEFKRIAPIDVRVQPWAASVDASHIAPGDDGRLLDLIQDTKDAMDLGGVTIGIHDDAFSGLSETQGAWGGFLGIVDENAAHATWHRPLTSVGHEVLHQIGFAHAGRSCLDVAGTEVVRWPPDDMGAIQGWGITWPRGTRHRHVFGAAVPGLFQPDSTARPRQFFDLMSYCARRNAGAPEAGRPDLRDAWISVRNWTRLLREDW
jgi:hypothetical protein